MRDDCRKKRSTKQNSQALDDNNKYGYVRLFICVFALQRTRCKGYFRTLPNIPGRFIYRGVLFTVNKFTYSFFVDFRIQSKNTLAYNCVCVGFVNRRGAREHVRMPPKPLGCAERRRFPTVFLAFGVNAAARPANRDIQAHLKIRQRGVEPAFLFPAKTAKRLDFVQGQLAVFVYHIINAFGVMANQTFVVFLVKVAAAAPRREKIWIELPCDIAGLPEKAFGVSDVVAFIQDADAPLPRVGFGVAGMPDDRGILWRIEPVVADDSVYSFVIAAARREPGSKQDFYEVVEIIKGIWVDGGSGDADVAGVAGGGGDVEAAGVAGTAHILVH